MAIYIQLISLCFSITAFIALLRTYKTRITRYLRFVLFALFMYILESATVGLLQGQNLFEIGALGVPTLLFAMGAVFTEKFLSRPANWGVFVQGLIICMVAAAIFKVFFSIDALGIELSDMHYQILSSAVILMSGYLTARMFLGISILDLVLAFFHLLIIAFSVTRTQLLILISMPTAAFAVYLPVLLRYSVYKRFGAIVGLGLLWLVAGQPSGANVAERWSAHFDEQKLGFDVTGGARIAEIDNQMEQLTSSASAFLIGSGLAAPNSLTGIYYYLVVEAVGAESADIGINGFGHNVYTSILYQSGVLFGSVAILALVYLLFVAIIVIRMTLKRSSATLVELIGLWGAFGVIGSSIFGLLGGTLGDRGLSFCYGVSSGMMVWAWSWMRVHSQCKQAIP